MARARREAAADDPHANGSGVIPACLVIEMMAQTAGLILPEDVSAAYVAALSGVRLHRAPEAGETIDLEARLARRMGGLYQFDCSARTGTTPLADGTIVLAVVSIRGDGTTGVAR